MNSDYLKHNLCLCEIFALDEPPVIIYLSCHVGECMVSIININNDDIKEPTCGYQNCNTSQILIFGGYVRVR